MTVKNVLAHQKLVVALKDSAQSNANARRWVHADVRTANAHPWNAVARLRNALNGVCVK